MMCSLSTNRRRIDLDQRMKKLRDKPYGNTGGTKDLQTGEVPHLGALFLHNAKTWSPNNSTQDVHVNVALQPDIYRKILLESVFTVSPTGHNFET